VVTPTVTLFASDQLQVFEINSRDINYNVNTEKYIIRFPKPFKTIPEIVYVIKSIQFSEQHFSLQKGIYFALIPINIYLELFSFGLALRLNEMPNYMFAQ